jgi:hypothetical protein
MSFFKGTENKFNFPPKTDETISCENHTTAISWEDLELLDFIKTYNLELLSEYKLITKQ